MHRSLLLDGESVYGLVANPLLLLLARVILAKCSADMSNLQVRRRLRRRRRHHQMWAVDGALVQLQDLVISHL